MEKLYEDMAWPTGQAMERLEGEMRAASARIARRRRERREAMLFGAAVLVVLALAAGGGIAVLRGGEPLMELITSAGAKALLGGMGLTLCIAPVLAYFAEEDVYEMEAQ